MLAAGIYIFTIGFAAFDVPAIIGWSNRVFTFSTYLVLQLSPTDALPRYGNAATLSVLLLGFAGFFSWWYAKMQKDAHRYQVVRGKAYRPQLIALGWLKAPVWCLIGLYLVLSTLLPLLVVVWASVLPYFQLPSAAAFASASFARYCGAALGFDRRRSHQHADPDGADADASRWRWPCASPGSCCARAYPAGTGSISSPSCRMRCRTSSSASARC